MFFRLLWDRFRNFREWKKGGRLEEEEDEGEREEDREEEDREEEEEEGSFKEEIDFMLLLERLRICKEGPNNCNGSVNWL